MALSVCTCIEGKDTWPSYGPCNKKVLGALAADALIVIALIVIGSLACSGIQNLSMLGKTGGFLMIAGGVTLVCIDVAVQYAFTKGGCFR